MEHKTYLKATKLTYFYPDPVEQGKISSASVLLDDEAAAQHVIDVKKKRGENIVQYKIENVNLFT